MDASTPSVAQFEWGIEKKTHKIRGNGGGMNLNDLSRGRVGHEFVQNALWEILIELVIIHE